MHTRKSVRRFCLYVRVSTEAGFVGSRHQERCPLQLELQLDAGLQRGTDEPVKCNTSMIHGHFCTAVELAVVYNLDNGGNRGGAEDLTLMLSEAN